MRRLTNLPNLIFCCFVLGCGSAATPDAKNRATVEHLANLEATKQSHHAGLRRELARIEKERGTPIQLQLLQIRSHPRPSKQAAWEIAFEPDRLARLQRRLADLFRGQSELIPVLTQATAANLLHSYDQSRASIRERLAAENHLPAVQHKQGLLADLAFIDSARAYVRLEQIHIAQAYSSRSPAETVSAFAAAFEVIQRIAHSGHFVARLEAADLRSEVWALCQEVLSRGKLQHDDYVSLLRIVESQLDDWPPDRDAWIADRAQGLHTYELIRDGKLLWLFEPVEVSQMRASGVLDQLTRAVTRVDIDQYFYLRAMRDLIEASEQPYYQRKQRLQTMKREWDAMYREPEFPAIAIYVMLSEVINADRLLAQDRALCEAWKLGLSVALERKKAIRT